MSTKQESTKIHLGECRIGESGIVEWLVMTIQHRESMLRKVGVYKIWEQIKVEGHFLECVSQEECLICFLPSGYVRKVLYTGEVFIGNKNYLSGRLRHYLFNSTSIYYESAFLLFDSRPIKVRLI
jgi:hypothetical protein